MRAWLTSEWMPKAFFVYLALTPWKRKRGQVLLLCEYGEKPAGGQALGQSEDEMLAPKPTGKASAAGHSV